MSVFRRNNKCILFGALGGIFCNEDSIRMYTSYFILRSDFFLVHFPDSFVRLRSNDSCPCGRYALDRDMITCMYGFHIIPHFVMPLFFYFLRLLLQTRLEEDILFVLLGLVKLMVFIIVVKYHYIILYYIVISLGWESTTDVRRIDLRVQEKRTSKIYFSLLSIYH